MANIALEDFIGTYRDELIRRCQVKVASRVPPDKKHDDRGIPLFLDQLCVQLRDSGSSPEDIGNSGKKHGHDLLNQGFSIDQVVHDYGDVCQSITELAVEMGAPISTDDFRTLNRCLDNAIAGAVTQFTLEGSVTRDKETAELHALAQAAVFAFRAIQAGNVGVAGSTGAVLERSLLALLTFLEARAPEPKQKETSTPAP
jgi:hypothetical protein